jgi:L-fuconolactonase
MPRPLPRRSFVQLSAAVAAGACAVGPAAASAEEPDAEALPIVDTHQHLWNLEQFKLPWLGEAPLVARSYTMRDYLDASAGLNVVKTVYMEVDVAPEHQQAEAEFVIDLCRQPEALMCGAVISGRPASEGFADYIRPLAKSPYIKGVREVLHNPRTPPGYCLDEAFVRGIRLLGELGLSYDLCMRPADLPDAAKLVAACSDVQFILDHCGNAPVQGEDLSQWRQDIAALAELPNVAGKISGIVAGAKAGTWTVEDLAPVVNHTLDVFGPGRVVFGGDWPVCTFAASLRQWVVALRQIVADRPLDERRRLFPDNAVRIYRLG